MVGAIIITHGNLAEALLTTAKAIAGDFEGVEAISLKGGEHADDLRGMLTRAIKEVDKQDGVIIFTDMFGGTPTNIALSFLKEGSIEVLAGVNLPLVIKFLNNRSASAAAELTAILVDYGKNSIVSASSMLKGKK